MFETHQQHNHLFYKICKARNIKILLTVPSRTPVTKDRLPNGNIYYLSDEHDKFLPLPKTIKPNIYKKIKLNEKFENIRDSNSDKRVYGGFLTSRSKYFKAVLKYLITKDTNVQTHYTYFGRSKIKVIFDRIAYELRKKYRKNFMEKNLSKNIENDSPFIYFPLHQEQERILLLGAPFYTNQFDVIQNIAKALPVGYNLYIKEHFMMNVRGWRSVSEMKKIMSLYNVKLLHHTVNSEELIKKSSLVISIKGTTAIEAAIHNKPSIIFENVGPYQLSSVHKLQSITELPQAIRKSLKIEVNPDEVRKYLDAINESAFEFPYVRLYIDFESKFKIGGYYANTEINSYKIMEYLEKFKPELTQLALFHIENIKRLSN
jgi:capsule polysaccharide modification protein KpsS